MCLFTVADWMNAGHHPQKLRSGLKLDVAPNKNETLKAERKETERLMTLRTIQTQSADEIDPKFYSLSDMRIRQKSAVSNWPV